VRRYHAVGRGERLGDAGQRARAGGEAMHEQHRLAGPAPLDVVQADAVDVGVAVDPFVGRVGHRRFAPPRASSPRAEAPILAIVAAGLEWDNAQHLGVSLNIYYTHELYHLLCLGEGRLGALAIGAILTL